MLAAATWIGLEGMGVGILGDEGFLVDRARDSLDRGELLPSFYNYPAVTFWLTLLNACVRWGAQSWASVFDGSSRNASLVLVMKEPGFLQATRIAFFVASSLLTIVSAYALSLGASGRRREALLAAALVGFSWELGYHARWIAPDAVMAQFATSSLAFASFGVVGHRPTKHLLLAAAAAGLACSTKYPGGILLIPITLSAVLWRSSSLRPGRRVLAVLACFVVAYLAFSPGTLLQYRKCFEAIGIGDAPLSRSGSSRRAHD